MKIISISGKGGTGKTTLAALLILALKTQGRGPLLAIDADPNSNLGDALGLKVRKTLGAVREDFFKERERLPAGMPKEAYLEMKLHEAVEESQGIDLLTMGRPEGPGCYCYLNNLLRRYIESLSKNYAYVIIDNEAGMEHLSRRTTQAIDDLILVADHSQKGVRTAARLKELALEMNIKVSRFFLVLGRAPEMIDPPVQTAIDQCGIPFLAAIPHDPQIASLDAEGKGLGGVDSSSPVVLQVKDICDRVKSFGQV